MPCVSLLLLGRDKCAGPSVLSMGNQVGRGSAWIGVCTACLRAFHTLCHILLCCITKCRGLLCQAWLCCICLSQLCCCHIMLDSSLLHKTRTVYPGCTVCPEVYSLSRRLLFKWRVTSSMTKCCGIHKMCQSMYSMKSANPLRSTDKALTLVNGELKGSCIISSHFA